MKNKIFPIILFALIIAAFVLLCNNERTEYVKIDEQILQEENLNYEILESEGTFVDKRDGKEYKYVKIGKQIWMAENLNYEVSGSKCYDNDAENCKKYGRLYIWNTAKIICPEGWHLPDNREWQILINYAGGEEKAGEKLKAKDGWNWNVRYEKTGNGTDDYGFSALPGGAYDWKSGFADIGYGGLFWSATSQFSDVPADTCVHYKFLHYLDGFAGPYCNRKEHLFSVRCVK